ncbi:hypothetical protein F443_00099 [Phytophthora nicotianae P1569]|uniref:Uncharacterized protein n=1 Tax=Phytophthora nicotianae P1569 TaxID=1317065 RepID=V9G2G2_PHYNI|nr:hypothetical protein F443_00099 [Phytophthora nicotianae P1569]
MRAADRSRVRWWSCPLLDEFVRAASGCAHARYHVRCWMHLCSLLVEQQDGLMCAAIGWARTKARLLLAFLRLAQALPSVCACCSRDRLACRGPQR